MAGRLTGANGGRRAGAAAAALRPAGRRRGPAEPGLEAAGGSRPSGARSASAAGPGGRRRGARLAFRRLPALPRGSERGGSRRGERAARPPASARGAGALRSSSALRRRCFKLYAGLPGGRALAKRNYSSRRSDWADGRRLPRCKPVPGCGARGLRRWGGVGRGGRGAAGHGRAGGDTRVFSSEALSLRECSPEPRAQVRPAQEMPCGV